MPPHGGMLGEEGELPPGPVLPNRQVPLPNAAWQFNPEKWCGLGSQIIGLVNTGRH